MHTEILTLEIKRIDYQMKENFGFKMKIVAKRAMVSTLTALEDVAVMQCSLCNATG